MEILFPKSSFKASLRRGRVNQHKFASWGRFEATRAWGKGDVSQSLKSTLISYLDNDMARNALCEFKTPVLLN